VRAGLPLVRQSAEVLLWMRVPFLSWRRVLDKVVVHGHTVSAEPIVRNNRIGIDTGACWTGCLTCLVLEEGDYRFLSTARPATPAAPGNGAAPTHRSKHDER
jgi:serine/threonine protein phosphatase 1